MTLQMLWNFYFDCLPTTLPSLSQPAQEPLGQLLQKEGLTKFYFSRCPELTGSSLIPNSPGVKQQPNDCRCAPEGSCFLKLTPALFSRSIKENFSYLTF